MAVYTYLGKIFIWKEYVGHNSATIVGKKLYGRYIYKLNQIRTIIILRALKKAQIIEPFHYTYFLIAKFFIHGLIQMSHQKFFSIEVTGVFSMGRNDYGLSRHDFNAEVF